MRKKQRTPLGTFSYKDEDGIKEIVGRIPRNCNMLILERAEDGGCVLYAGKLPKNWRHRMLVKDYVDLGVHFAAHLLAGELGLCARLIEGGSVPGYLLVRDTTLAKMSGLTNRMWKEAGRENEQAYSRYIGHAVREAAPSA